jgi:hypothetical protein
MADSKFLKWQDKTGDGTPDVCDEIAVVAEIDPCYDCKPLPSAMVPDWKTRDIKSPFKNERECLYQIAIVTNLKTTGAGNTSNETAAQEALDEIYTLHASDAMGGLLLFYNKKDNKEARDFLIQGLYAEDYYLNYVPNSNLQLLYSVPVAVLDSLAEADEEDEEPDEEEEESPISAAVTYETSELFDKLMTIRKGLDLYNRYFKVAKF